MFDIGGWEFLLIAILGIIVVGPKELPRAIRTVRIFITKTRNLTRDFQAGLEEVAREADLDTVSDELKEIVDPDALTSGLRGEIENSIDPDGEGRDAMTFDTEWTDDELLEDPAAVLSDDGAQRKGDSPANDSESIPENGPKPSEAE